MLTITKPLLSLVARDLMSPEVVAIPEEMSLQGAARLLSRASIYGAPVVDSQGRCVGLISARDFMHWVEHEPGEQQHHHDEPAMCSAWQLPDDDEQNRCSVREVMTRDPAVVAVGTPIGDIARMMLDAHIHRVVVADSERRPIGVVSSMDILAAVYDAARHEPVGPDGTAGLLGSLP
jgi:CBS domain-containing protein